MCISVAGVLQQLRSMPPKAGDVLQLRGEVRGWQHAITWRTRTCLTRFAASLVVLQVMVGEMCADMPSLLTLLLGRQPAVDPAHAAQQDQQEHQQVSGG